MWSISTILTGLYSFMVEKTPTTGSIETNDAAKRKFAKDSLEYNVKDKVFCSLFPEYVEIWEKREEERKKREAEARARGEIVEEMTKIVKSEGGWGEGAVWHFAAGLLALMSLFYAIRFI